MDFTAKVAIVTGAGQGIGYEIALQLCKAGATVFLNDIDANLATKSAASIAHQSGSACIALPGDAGDPPAIGSLIAQIAGMYGRLDIAVANAGITLYGDFLTYLPANFARVMEVNCGGSFFLAQAAALQMKKQESGGSILFMSSVTGHQAHRQLAAYGMSKAALEMLAKTLVIELSPYNITINTVAPGATLTERTAQDPGYETTWSQITPMGRPASTGDIAQAVLFLVSDGARHITGQTIVIDGGWTSVSPSPF